MNSTVKEHPAYISHTVEAEYRGYTLLSVTYSEDHEDYEGGTRLECWDANDEYVEDVSDEDEFLALVDCTLEDCDED
jgi:hypothetical protein